MAGKEAQLKIIVNAQDNTKGTFRSLNSQLESAEKQTHSWTGAIAMATRGLAVLGGTAAGFLGYGVKIAADLQTAEIGLTTLLGSADQARETVDRLKVEAARTPFELPGLTQATQLLTSVTKDGNKSIDIILDIGEALAAMGKGQAELDRIIVNLQQVASIGKASMIDIKQFAYAGIPIFDMLEKHFASAGTKTVVNNTSAISKNADQVRKLEQQLAVTLQRQREFTENTSESTRIANGFKVDELRSKIAGLTGEMNTLQMTNGKAGQSLVSIEDAIENGEVTFELLTQLFDKANDEGGLFFNAFVNNSKSFNQAFSNMKDSIGIFLADVAKNSGLLDGLTTAMMRIAAVLGDYEHYLGLAQEKTAAFFALIDKETGLITYLRDVWAALVLQFNEQLRPALVQLWETLKPFEPFLIAMAQVIGVVLYGAVLGLITILGGLSVILIDVLTKATELVNFIAGTFLKIWDNLTGAIAGTVSWVDALVSSLERAVALMAQLGSKIPSVGALSAFKPLASPISRLLNVNDAVIAPGGNIISTHPDDYLIATKNPASLSSGVNITITGNTFLDEYSAERVGDLLIRRLKQSNAI